MTQHSEDAKTTASATAFGAAYLDDLVAKEQEQRMLRERDNASATGPLHQRLLAFIQQDEEAREVLKLQRERALARRNALKPTIHTPGSHHHAIPGSVQPRFGKHPQARPEGVVVDGPELIFTPPFASTWSSPPGGLPDPVWLNEASAGVYPGDSELEVYVFGGFAGAGVAFTYDAPTDGTVVLLPATGGQSPGPSAVTYVYEWGCGDIGDVRFLSSNTDGFIGWYVWDVTTRTVVLDARGYLWNASASGWDSISGATGSDPQYSYWSSYLPVQSGHRYEIWFWCGAYGSGGDSGTTQANLVVWVDALALLQVWLI